MKTLLGILVVVFVVLASFASAAKQSINKAAITVINTDLHKAPSYKSEILSTPAIGTELILGQRSRAWYQVEYQAHPNAWIKMLAVRLKQSPKRAGELGVVSLLDSMTTKPTSSTAVRGFDSHSLADATPNVKALQAISNFKPSQSELQKFVEQGELVFQEVRND